MHCSKYSAKEISSFSILFCEGDEGPACCTASLQGKCEVFLLPGTLAHDQVHHVLFKMSYCTWGEGATCPCPCCSRCRIAHGGAGAPCP